MTALESYLGGFTAEPGYLNYGRMGPLAASVVEQSRADVQLLASARYGSLGEFDRQDARVRAALAPLLGRPAEQIVFQPNTSTGLMHAMFGLHGGVLLSAQEFPSLPIAAVRAQQALGRVKPLWIEAVHGVVTPGQIREQLDHSVAAVAVSLVDSRTGFLADLEGIREVIGDRLLIVDAIQGFGIVDAPFELADVVVSGGQKWLRSGWGTGFMALSEIAISRLVPVFSGFTGTTETEPWGHVPPPASGASAYRVTNPDPMAESRFATALEEIAKVGVDVINSVMSASVAQVLELADEFSVPIVSSRSEQERAGIVVLQPGENRLALLNAALHNHGVSVSSRLGTIRLSVHAGTSVETLTMLRSALVEYAATASR